MRADNTRHIIDAARHRRELTRSKAIQALRVLDAKAHTSPSRRSPRAATVSRSWLYAQPDIRTEIERLRVISGRAPATPVPSRQRSSDASLLRRLETANERIRQLAEENRTLRAQLAQALGERRATATATTTPAQPPLVATR